MSTSAPKILLVDDKKENLFALEHLLRPLGAKIYKAQSGNEALSLALTEDFALILLDVQMPEMDGYEVIALLHSEPRTQKIPVIFITAYCTDEAQKLHGYHLGAVDYIHKPFNEEVLITKVKVFLELYMKNSEYQQLHRQQQLILDSAGEGIFGVDPHGNINFANPAAANLLERSIEELIGLPLENILPLPDPKIENSNYKNHVIYQVGLQGYFHRIKDDVFISKSGKRVPIDYVITAIRDDKNEHLGSVIVFTDITERKVAEQTHKKLQQAQRMESIGQLTGGLAHDFNNLLMIVQGNLELLSDSIKKESEENNYLEAANSAVVRGTELIKRMLAFARKQTLNPEHINLNERINDIFKLIKPALGETIDVQVALSENLWSILVDPGQFENALVNLAINARDAMPNGGKVIIEAENVCIDEKIIMSNYELNPGEYVKISVTDTGTGMSNEIKQHLFEPFYTTKERGKGTGLGLSMVYGFIKQSGGYITLYSEEGHGTTFHLYFARSQAQQDISDHSHLSEEQTKKASLTGHETILVVEDESAVRQISVSYLKQLGYNVLEAGSGSEALEVLKQTENIDLLFSDVVMPGGMTGPQLAEHVKQMLPQVKLLFASGYPSTALTVLAEKEKTSYEYLSKPYRLSSLGEKVRDIFQGGLS